MSNQTLTTNLLRFYIDVEKLKTTIRHSYTSDKARMESSAEHSWMLCLIAMSLFEHLTIQIDQLRVLKILIIHDLAEAIVGDIPAHDLKRRENKKEREKNAFEKLVENLSQKTQTEFLNLWNEYEAKQTQEAKIAQAIDKLEAPLQHNISDIETWDQNDFDVHPFYKYEYAKIDQFLQTLRDDVETMSRKKITDAKQLSRLKQEMQEKYEALNKKNL